MKVQRKWNETKEGEYKVRALHPVLDPVSDPVGANLVFALLIPCALIPWALLIPCALQKSRALITDFV